jgi:hypothetical protein
VYLSAPMDVVSGGVDCDGCVGVPGTPDTASGPEGSISIGIQTSSGKCVKNGFGEEGCYAEGCWSTVSYSWNLNASTQTTQCFIIVGHPPYRCLKPKMRSGNSSTQTQMYTPCGAVQEAWFMTGSLGVFTWAECTACLEAAH